MIAFLNRITDDTETLGNMVVFDGISKVFECVTLELPWIDNRQSISCIPTDLYQVVPWSSPTKGLCFSVLKVPDRANILIHAGNFKHNTEGCILIGNRIGDLNGDGELDICESRNALDRLINKCPNGFMLRVSDAKLREA